MVRQSHQLFTNSPFEEKTTVYKQEVKANPPMVMFADETSRGALNKAVLPNFLVKPPFGRPRFKNIFDLRRLGNTPQARMCKQTIIDEVVAIEWSIVPSEETDDISEELQAKIDEPTRFLKNPNTNNESLEYLFRQMLEDVLDLDSGIWVKEFDDKQRMVELKAVDGSTFLKNPDMFGKYTTRDDIIPFGIVLDQQNQQRPLDSFSATNASLNFNLPINNLGLSSAQASERGAYFQFGFTSNARPIAFGRREIVWFEQNPQTNQIYGKSPTESIQNVLQNLKYSIEYALDYFEDNNVPKGFIQLTGADTEEMNAFRDRWNELQLKTNAEGLLKKNFHRVPITNTENAQFIRIQFSSAELQLIESQQWFSKLVWSTYGVTPSELGFTENSNLATEINQSKVFKRKAILPKLRMIEQRINNDILSEWDFHDEIKFKFNTFDIDDEKSKFELYKTQTEMGFRTINELRVIEGLEELEEDEIPESQESNEQDKDKDKDLPDQEDSKKRAEKKELKFEDILNEINKLLVADKNALIREMRKNSNNRLAQVKAFSDIIGAVKNFFNIGTFGTVIDRLTNLLFQKGINNVEALMRKEEIQVNTITTSPEKKEFLSEMAQQNFKDLANETQEKLIRQLKIGVSNGEGITKLTERVNSVVRLTKSRAEMIAKTEAVRMETQGQIHAGNQLIADGVNLKKWLLWVNDNRTSDLTKALHSKYGTPQKAIPFEDNFKLNFKGKDIDQLGPPFHPNERDTLMTLIIDK